MADTTLDQPVSERRGVDAINFVPAVEGDSGVITVFGRAKKPRTQGTTHQECKQMIARCLRFPLAITAGRFDHYGSRSGSGILVFCCADCSAPDRSIPGLAS